MIYDHIKHGKQRLTKILTDPEHRITKALDKRESITRKGFPFVIPKCKSEKYQKSYLQKFLRLLEKDGYTPTSNKTEKQQISKKVNEDAICDICKKVFKNTRGVNQHKTKIHKPATC